MLVLSTDVLPEHISLKEVHGLIETTHPIHLFGDGFVLGFVEHSRDEHREAYDAFIKAAGDVGNVIYGVRVSTSTATFADGTFLMMTHCGTLATCDIRGPS